MRILSDMRRAAPRSVCALVAAAPVAQAYALGQPDVAVQFSTWLDPANGFNESASIQIHNYMGSTSAMGEGMTLSIIEDQTASALRAHSVQVVKVTGGDARGIPPRGRPV